MKMKRTPKDLLVCLERLGELSGGSVDQLTADVARIEESKPQLKRHIRAFRLYWGFTNEGSLTQTVIGNRLSVSSSRVTQLRQKIERMLHHPARWKE